VEVDLLIAGGQVADGSGAPVRRADIGISGDRVTLVGLADGVTGRQVINAEGLVVSPGFIDLHSHADFILPLPDHHVVVEPFVRQGVTTVLTGNCGFAPAPVDAISRPMLHDYAAFIMDEPLTWQWQSMGEFLDHLSMRGVMLNCAQLAAHGTLRIAVMGMQDRTPTPDERERLVTLTRQALLDGAFGLSTGLMYPPGMYARPDELIELARVVHEFGGLVTSHIRGYSDTMCDAVEELIALGKQAQVCVQLSHLGAFGRRHWPKTYDAMRTVERARGEGVNIHFDIVPWVAGHTSLAAIFPPWAVEGGMPQLLARLRDPALRERIRETVLTYVPRWPPWHEGGGWSDNLSLAFGWENIVVLSLGTQRTSPLIGKNLAEIAGEWQVEPFEAAVRLLEHESGNVFCAFFGLSGDLEHQDIIRDMVAHPLGLVILDAISQRKGIPMPSVYATFPHLLGRFVRQEQALSLEQAVHKLTGLPASILGLRDRGLLKEGAYADVTIFDAGNVQGAASYLQARPEPPRGIEYVMVNGQVILERGHFHAQKRTGAVLRRL
jgi:N-acyl-D-amino-acid deacylase